MRTLTSTGAALVIAAAIHVGQAQETVTVPKDQYQKLVEEHQKLLDEMKEMKAFKARMEEAAKKTVGQQTETDQALDELDKKLKEAKQVAKESFPGSTRFLLTGYGSAGLIYQDHGGARQFSATFNPIFLWKLNDRLLFEGELEAELEGHETSVALELAQISYVVNDYVTVGAGKFLNPMNYFVERQHMAWVNKMPDKPLTVYDGLLPEATLGLQVRGGVPVGSAKFGYAFFAANAPELRNDPATVGMADLGTLEFNNFDNVGKHIAVGGRVGFLPIPEFEVGYGFQYSTVAPPGAAASVRALLQSADMSYVRDSARLKGTINFKAQYVWSDVGNFTYDPAATAGGPFLFKNNRNGGYVQLAYRPSLLENPVVKNFEPVARYDVFHQANTLTGVDERRWTVGLNYWLNPSSVLKIAYEFDRQRGANADRHNGFLLQLATGF